MTDQRPDPDELLARLKQEEAQAQRGKLKIFFGASAGVGKTYAMLSAARAQREQGVDVVIGVIETHGRADTQAMLAGFETLPLKEVGYRGRVLKEFDLDGTLKRAPRLVLVDELAHSNVAGSRHPKRWQDVEELLDAGIDVWSTINVQHLETLNDVVSGITGIRVWETVPDRVFDEADEVVIVDLPPDDLLQRLKEGKVYLPQQAATAVRNFFRKGNLIALRELALRRTADRVDEEMLDYRRAQSGAPVWQTREALLLCIGPDERSEKLVRGAARLAGQLDVPWHCICVETPQLQRLPEAQRQRLNRALNLAQESGATVATPSGSALAATIVKYAHDHNLSRIVLGRDTGRPPPRWRNTLAEAVGGMGPDLDVMQIALPARERAGWQPWWRREAAAEGVAAARRPAWRPYVWSAAICAGVTLLTAPLVTRLDLANIVMVFLLAVVLTAVWLGRGPAVLAAFLSVGAFDFFYVPPRFTFSVSDAQYLLTFAIMLVVALVIGQLTAGLRFQADVATQREERMRALYAMSRELSGALMAEQVAEVAARFMRSEFEARAALLVADVGDRLLPAVTIPGAPAPVGVDGAIAQWAFDHAEAAGQGTHTLPASTILYLPLKAPMRMRGVLAIEPQQAERLAGPEQRRVLDTCASLLAISLERIHYVEVAQSTTVQMESERLRNSLLAAISHDLRTPLAALVGMADEMGLSAPPGSRQAEIAQAMREASRRMNSLVVNLLDMARLQSGQVALNRQWLPLEEAVGGALRALTGSIDPQRVKVQLPAELPLLHVDPVLFERVLCNLLENAVKYTPAGSAIEIGATVVDDSVRIVIDDHGPGLPRHREEAIFQMFERGRKESATPGVGLGLAICRAIVEAHGGHIRGETRPSGGARFMIELPRGEPPAIDEPGEEA
ncbi:two-component system sensor histidine kinase KdpD [Aquabacterium sp.]|uniref:two-component system sensor histidine kinase KdpD n=1 Tax=Aquabacterium sp. TaxID=1872578 RepID=UPI00378387E3